MTQKYQVVNYTSEVLRDLLSDIPGANRHDIAIKPHLAYFENYFDSVGVKTILAEFDYVDRDYLEDFASYYVRCFHEYRRHCTRLHFFTYKFEEQAFTDMLKGCDSSLSQELLQETYRGFMVVKPLPKTIIGRTCLQPHPSASHNFFPITRPYTCHLFGIPLKINSLAFQEQDSVAAACATSALWSTFQGTGLQFQHPIPSPVEITRAATSHVPHDTRTFPSRGLGITQMSDAIRSVGLEPLLLSAQNQDVLKSAIYAYLKGRIPILLGVALSEHKDDEDDKDDAVPMGFHAVAVTGFSLDNSKKRQYSATGTWLKALSMNLIYAHDDQIGPFAPMMFVDDKKFMDESILSTSWNASRSGSTVKAKANELLVPLYHKIRIPLETVQEMIFSFDRIVEMLRKTRRINLRNQLEWDVYLTSSNTIKEEFQNITLSSLDYKATLLTFPMPRFLWRATALLESKPVIDLLFDATDVEQGSFFTCAIDYDIDLAKELRHFADLLLRNNELTPKERRFFDWYSNFKFEPEL